MGIAVSGFRAMDPGLRLDEEQHVLEELFALGGVGRAQEFFAKLPQSLNIGDRPPPRELV